MSVFNILITPLNMDSCKIISVKNYHVRLGCKTILSNDLSVGNVQYNIIINNNNNNKSSS